MAKGKQAKVPSQHAVEAALLRLPVGGSWSESFIEGVAVTRLDRQGQWFRVGMREEDVLRPGDGGVLDLMDTAHAIRLGLGRYK